MADEEVIAEIRAQFPDTVSPDAVLENAKRTYESMKDK